MSGDLIQITARPTLISVPTLTTTGPGRTIAQIVDDQLSASRLGAVVVDLNGEPVPFEKWGAVVPAAGDHLLIYTTIHGGEGKNPLRTILTIVVIAAATYFGGPAGGIASYTGSTAAGVIGGAVILTAGSLLVNAIAPLRTPSLGSSNIDYGYASSPTYSLSGAQNSIIPWGPIPMVLGKHRHYPPMGAKPYTELIGNNEYLRLLLIWGHGPLSIEDMKIGDTPIENFEGIEIQTINGYAGDPDLSLFPSQVNQSAVGADLTYAGGEVTRTVAAGADEISFDIYSPRGMVSINQVTGKKSKTSVGFDIRYREVGGAWISLDGAVNYGAQTWHYPAGGQFTLGPSFALYAHVDGTIQAYAGLYERPLSKRICTVEVTGRDYETFAATVIVVTNFTPAGTTGMVCTRSGVDIGDVDIDITAGTADFDAVFITGNTTEALRTGFKIEVDNSVAHEIGIQRTTADSASDFLINDSVWGVLRGITNANPINFPFPVAASAIRIKATGQLTGIVDNINAICTTICQAWNGADWNDYAESTKPAALYRHVLTCSANPKPKTLTQIDDDQLADWYEFCETNGYEFNMVRDFRSSVRDCLADIAAAGMASPNMPNGKWTVAVDHFDKSIAQHFTPRNSWGFSAEKVLFDAPHAVRVRFKDEDNGYEWDERIVYADGYTSANATLYEAWEFPGVTNSDLIWKHTRRRMAMTKLRPESYSFFADFERIACHRGSLIRVGHIVPGWGGGWGRVKSLIVGTGAEDGRTLGVILDETVTMAAGADYACRFRLADEDATSLVMAIETVEGESATLNFTLDPPILTTLGPQVGDLAMFGETDQETTELIVHSIESIDDLAAKIIAVDYSPAIEDADSGTIPAFDTNITGPLDVTKLKPYAPTISMVESGTRALDVNGTIIRASMLVTLSQAAMSTLRIKEHRIRYRIDGEALWSYASAEVPNMTVRIAGVTESETYEIQAQAISLYGLASDWSTASYEYVIGQSDLPSDVEGFQANIVGSGAHLSWDPVNDYDLSHYRVRWSPQTSGATWVASVDVIKRVAKPATSVTVPAIVGTYLIKAVDFAGNASENAATSITTVARIAGLNVVDTFGQADPAWSGTGTDADADAGLGGIVLDDPATAEVGYYEFDSYVDLTDVFTSRCSSALYVSGQDLAEDLYDLDDLYDAINLYGDVEGLYSVALQLATTNDDPAGTPTWSAWKPFLVGDYTARAFKFRAVLNGMAPSITPVLGEFLATIDMPDRVVGFTAAIGSGGDSVSFDPPFFATPEIGISTLDGQEGDAYVITNLDATGFDIAFTNGGSGVARNIRGVAKGYGSLET